jgi:hypothetical protein
MTKRAKSLPKGTKRKTKRSRARAAKQAPAKRKVRSAGNRRAVGGDPLDALVDSSARALALPLEPSWRPTIKANLEVTLRLAETVTDFPLPDDSEPAPVFVA